MINRNSRKDWKWERGECPKTGTALSTASPRRITSSPSGDQEPLNACSVAISSAADIFDEQPACWSHIGRRSRHKNFRQRPPFAWPLFGRQRKSPCSASRRQFQAQYCGPSPLGRRYSAEVCPPIDDPDCSTLLYRNCGRRTDRQVSVLLRGRRHTDAHATSRHFDLRFSGIRTRPLKRVTKSSSHWGASPATTKTSLLP